MPPIKSKSKYSRTDSNLPSSQAFEVDTSGSAAIRHAVLHGAFAGRARKGVQRTLRVDQILSEPTTHGPPAVSGRVRGATRDVNKSKLLSTAERKRLQQMVIRKGHGSGINSIDPEKRNGTAAAVKPPPPPAGDIWQSNSLSTAVISKSAPVKPPASLRPNETIIEVLHSVPATGLMAIPHPHPGQSYNPTFSDHQAILAKTLEKLEEEQCEAEKAAEIHHRITQALKPDRTKPLGENFEEDIGDGETDEEPMDSTVDPAIKKPVKKKVAKRKSNAQRNRRKRERQALRMHALRKEAKRVAHSLRELPKLVRAMTAEEREARQARAARKAKRLALVAEYGLRAVRGGKPKGLQAVEDRHEFQLTEDLTESGLRGLKTVGNLWRDWSRSNMRRGRLDARPKAGLLKGQRFQKGKMFKEVEKHAWKNFEA